MSTLVGIGLVATILAVLGSIALNAYYRPTFESAHPGENGLRAPVRGWRRVVALIVTTPITAAVLLFIAIKRLRRRPG